MDEFLENMGFNLVCTFDVGSADVVADVDLFSWLSIEDVVEEVEDAEGDKGPDRFRDDDGGF